MGLKKFKVKKKIDPVFEKNTNGKSVLKSTLKRMVCYRCQFPGKTLVKHSIGYAHQDPRICIGNIKRVKLWGEFEKAKKRILRRQRRIDTKILNWLRLEWQKIWNFFKRVNIHETRKRKDKRDIPKSLQVNLGNQKTL